MIRFIAALLFVCVASIANAQIYSDNTLLSINPVAGTDPTVGVLPSYNDAFANWKNAGLMPIGGIPTRSTQCGSTISPSGITPPATGDDADTINAAIAACSSGDVVLLSTGTFQIAMSEYILLGQPVTLRGSGTCTNASTPYCQTVISVFNGLLAWTGGTCGTDTSHVVSCVSNPGIAVQPQAASDQFDFGWSGSLGTCGLLSQAIGCGTEFDADATQGQSTIQVHSTTGFSAGVWALVDEASGGTWQTDPVGPNLYGKVWGAPDWLSTSGSPATGRVQWAKFGGPSCSPSCTGDMGNGAYPYNNPGTIQSYYDRATTEIHLVKSIGAGPCPGVNCTITFDDPLSIAYRKSGAGTFTGAISGTTLTTSGDPCTLTVAMIVSDPSTSDNVKDGTYVTAVSSCSGGVGSYTVNLSQTVSSETMNFGAHQAHVYYPTHQSGGSMPLLSEAGVENMTIERPTSGGVDFQFCAYCWMKNVEVVGWGGGAVNFNYSVRNQMDTSFSNHCGNSVNNGAEYPIGMQDSATETYIVNNIILICGKGMVGKAAAASVVAYNYSDETMYDSYSGIGDYWMDMGVNGSHWAGTHQFLFEGNWGDNLDNDNTHGNQVYHTYFRNWGTAIRSTFEDPSNNNRTVDDATNSGWACGTSGYTGCTANNTGPLRAVGPMEHDYWMAYVGNVLGLSGVTTSGNGWAYSGTYASGGKVIWLPGWNSDASNPSKSDPNLNTVSGAFLFKHGNYDYYDGSIVDWTAGYSHNLPNSFYLFSAPAFFSAGSGYPWPWVTPTAASPIQSGPSGCGGTCSALPALARWQAGTPFVQP